MDSTSRRPAVRHLACTIGLALIAWIPSPTIEAVPCSLQEAPLGDAPALAALELPLDDLATWGRREFTYVTTTGDSEQSLGTVALTTSVADGTFTFTDRADLTVDGSHYWIETTAAGPLGNELRPTTLSVRGTTDDLDGKTFEMQADIGPSSASVTAGGRTKTVTVPAGTLSDAAFFRLATLLPRRAGVLARFDRFLDSSEMLIKPGGTIGCSGPEALEHGGTALKTWRFDLSSDGRLVISIWVDEEGRPLKVVMDGTKTWVAKG